MLISSFPPLLSNLPFALNYPLRPALFPLTYHPRRSQSPAPIASLTSCISSEAGVDYKNTLIEDLKKDPRVTSVEDVGVNDKTDKTGESL